MGNKNDSNIINSISINISKNNKIKILSDGKIAISKDCYLFIFDSLLNFICSIDNKFEISNFIELNKNFIYILNNSHHSLFKIMNNNINFIRNYPPILSYLNCYYIKELNYLEDNYIYVINNKIYLLYFIEENLIKETKEIFKLIDVFDSISNCIVVKHKYLIYLNRENNNEKNHTYFLIFIDFKNLNRFIKKEFEIVFNVEKIYYTKYFEPKIENFKNDENLIIVIPNTNCLYIIDYNIKQILTIVNFSINLFLNLGEIFIIRSDNNECLYFFDSIKFSYIKTIKNKIEFIKYVKENYLIKLDDKILLVKKDYIINDL